MRWLQNRSPERPIVHGIAAFETDNSMTRSWQLRVPDGIKYVVIDTPAALQVQRLSDFTRGVHAILVPVLPSDIDSHAASRLIADMLLVARSAGAWDGLASSPTGFVQTLSDTGIS